MNLFDRLPHWGIRRVTSAGRICERGTWVAFKSKIVGVAGVYLPSDVLVTLFRDRPSYSSQQPFQQPAN